MKTRTTAQTLLALVFLFSSALAWGGGSADADEIDFEPVPGFFQLPDSIKLGMCSGVAVNSEGEVFLFHRGKPPILVLDETGKFLRSWGDDVIAEAHGLRIDRDDNVWVTDIGNHQVFKFGRTGKLLMAMGKAGTAGDAVDEFNKPTDVAFGSRGEIYVSDGYGNSRVMKFTPNGGFLTKWGEAGNGPSQFDTPHTIVVDRQGRVIVGDRENDRVQVFEAGGKLLEIWPGFAPFGLELDPHGNLFVADGRANKVLRLNANGKVVGSWGEEGKGPGQFQLPHMLATDSAGNLYVAEIAGMRFQKLARQRDTAAPRDAIELERAKVELKAAHSARDSASREALLNKAADRFRKFVEEYEDHLLSLTARLQLASVLTEQGRSSLVRAKRAPADNEAKLHNEARQFFGEALQQVLISKDQHFGRLEKFPKVLDRNKDRDAIAERTQLRASYLQAQILIGALHEELAETWSPSDQQQREELTAAGEQYGDIYRKYRTLLAGLYAHMYEGRCLQKLGDLDAALENYDSILNQPDGPSAFRNLKTRTLTLALECWLDPSKKEYAKALSLGEVWMEKLSPTEVKQPDGKRIHELVEKARRLKS